LCPALCSYCKTSITRASSTLPPVQVAHRLACKHGIRITVGGTKAGSCYPGFTVLFRHWFSARLRDPSLTLIFISNFLIFQNEVSGIPLVNYPNVCTRGTDGNSKYCSEHKCSAITVARSKSQRDNCVSEIMVPGMPIYSLWQPVINFANITLLQVSPYTKGKRSTRFCHPIQLLKRMNMV